MLDSSIWWEKPQRDIFITALLKAEPYEVREPEAQLEVRHLVLTGWMVPEGWYGFLKAAAGSLVHQAMVEKEAGLIALEALGSPDPESKSKAFEGRRLVRVDGGYIVLNFMEYRERDHTSAERQKRWREKQKQGKGKPKPKPRMASKNERVSNLMLPTPPPEYERQNGSEM